tara:strand:- start:430 stop:1098 length:669 start_codon:yes stop_codon:yes gene_type:complete
MNKQLVLDFPIIKNYLEQDFYVSSSNHEAFKTIDSWPKWIKRTVNIYGPSGSGKSHLSSIFSNKTISLKIKYSELSDKTFENFKTKEVLIIEDFVNDGKKEELLYSLHDNVDRFNKYLLFTSVVPMNSMKFKLPDLKSRISSCNIIEIKLPDDNLVEAILSKRLSDRQIVIDKKYMKYAIKRIERSYENLSKFIHMLDKLSLKSGKSINFKVIREVLKKYKS